MRDEIIYSQTYNYTDCLSFDTPTSLFHTLTAMTLGAAYAAGIIRTNLWAIILPTPTGYKVNLYREKE